MINKTTIPIRGNILYIEDNFLNMEIVRRTVNLMGYNLIEAFDGISGIATARRDQPDLILVDINLPDMNGVDVIKELRATTETKNVPIVVLTADVLNKTYRECVNAGCDGYLNKPLSRVTLMKTVQQFTPVI